ncbi:unnamed protein product [Adineta steineri]|uniref:Zinc finger MYM-type protein 1-like n=1 Tax=Adineta steineri TaxID=433720 RepID=A0A819TKX8_9BILA|nr:unnamed protein product [Adineta steineri]
MDQPSKESKRGTIRSFFNSYNIKSRKSTSAIPHNTTDSLSNETMDISSTSINDEQQEQISTYSSSLSPRLLSPSSNCFSPLDKPEENISSALFFSSMVLSPSNKRRQEQTSLSLPKSPRLSSPSSRVSQLSSPSSSADQQEKASSLLSSDVISDQIESSSFESSASSNKPTLNPSDLSSSFNEPPTQPKLATYPLNKDKRCFRIQWLSQYSWHSNSGINLNNRNQSDAYARGFNSWKNALSRNQGFPKHELSKSHKQAVVNFEEYIVRKQSSSSVLQVLDKSRKEVIEQNRTKLMKIVSLLHICGRQMIAIRGHSESEASSNRGNFIELLKWSSATDPIALSILNDSAKNSTYLSPSTQNNLVTLIASDIRQQIAQKISGCVFTLMVDESRDISGNQQLSVVVRVIDVEVTANNHQNCQSLFKEYFVGFVRLVEFDAQSLTNEIVKFLSSINIDINSCVAMCFDGASVLSGVHSGVQSLLRKQHIPRAIYVHCYAHKLNLTYVYFHKSSVTNEMFKKVQQQLKIDRSDLSTNTTLKNWAETRWDSRWISIQSIIDNYQVLLQSLEELEEEGTDRSIDARGLLFALKEPLFIVTIFIIHNLFGKIKILSDQLKSESLDFGKAHILINSVIKQINDLRSEDEFDKLFEQIGEFCFKHDISFNIPIRHRRAKTVSTRFKDCIVMSTVGQREEISDKSEFQDRIFIHNLEILRGIASLSPDNTKFLEVEELKYLCNIFQCDILLLVNEIKVLKPMLEHSKSQNIVELYFEIVQFKQAFPTFTSLIVGALTIPVSSTTTERTFSKMKYIKTAARNSMSDGSLEPDFESLENYQMI